MNEAALLDRLGQRIFSLAGQASDAFLRKFTQPFLQRFLIGFLDEKLTSSEEDSFLDSALTLLRLAARRKPGEAKILTTPKAIYIVNDDMPFLVDSIVEFLKSAGLFIDRVIHPVLFVQRDTDGIFLGLEEQISSKSISESMIAVLLRPGTALERTIDLEPQIKNILKDVRIAVMDWNAMRQEMLKVRQNLEIDQQSSSKSDEKFGELVSFLDWLEADHFTFLGVRQYRLEKQGRKTTVLPMMDSNLGILKEEALKVFHGLNNDTAHNNDIQNFLTQDRLIVTKTRRVSTVHRRVPMDAVAVKELDEKGHPVKLTLFVGLFTSRAYGRAARDIPVLRQKVAAVLDRTKFSPTSHNGKLLTHILDTYPRDELFQTSEEELYEAALQLLHLEKRPHFDLYVRRDKFDQFISLMIYFSRERYSFALRQRLEVSALKEVPGATDIIFSQVSPVAENLTRLHVILATDPAKIHTLDTKILEQKLAEEARAWTERLAQILQKQNPEDSTLVERYSEAFPLSYRDTVNPTEALAEIPFLEALLIQIEDAPLIRIAIDKEGAASLFVYKRGLPLALSDLLPFLERFGFRVLTETAYRIQPKGHGDIWLQILSIVLPACANFEDGGHRFGEAFSAVWQGIIQSDDLNQLIVVTPLTARQVLVLRTYMKYLRQTRFRHAQGAIQHALIRYPALASKLVALFETLHRPHGEAPYNAKQNRIAGDKVAEDIRQGLTLVANADDDAVISAFLLLIISTLRTNFFLTDRPVLALKLDSPALGDLLPLPRPMVEVFVYNARLEAIHLRGGKIARGGIRWSDRREDFRTEILGLMKAQMVKNAVIVPVGSKGGFVLKQPPVSGDRSALQKEAIACYELMMQGLLDVTDNLTTDGQIVQVPNLVKHDGDDPYLVVAADKGTASFSDIANRISQSNWYWLDDAFASGGSSGYDHKRMAITARGAWESVKRHFREMNIDVQTQPVRVVGVGDMSGDVFGNAMLRSNQLKLIAAFDHRHIFCDPDPDALISFKERQRLFDLPSSSWDDYDKALLSAGGAVFARSQKNLTLSSEIRAALGIEAEHVTPNELIESLLKAKVDLLFFGGIGTYIKGPQETHADVGDRANDFVRINGDEIQATVLGEGANLAVTQKGRIAYALKGGRLNTDFIDNSAGVDTSDHEVNIKILFKPLLDRDEISRSDRDRLLVDMTDEVASLVLTDNYQQTQTLSCLEMKSSASLKEDVRLIRALEKSGHLHRQVESLPDDETLKTRMTAGMGLTRPELSVLLAYGKITAYDTLMKSDLALQNFEDELRAYFPKALQKRFSVAISNHPLRREIVFTRIVNLLINWTGPSFLNEMMDRTGAAPADIVTAFLRVRQAFQLDDTRASIEALDGKIDAAQQTAMLLATTELIARVVPRLLMANLIKTTTNHDRAAIEALSKALRQQNNFIVAQPSSEIPASLVERINLFPYLTPALDLVPLAEQTGWDLERLANLYVQVGRRFGTVLLSEWAHNLPILTDWDRRAANALIDEAFGLTQRLTARLLKFDSEHDALAKLQRRYGAQLERLDSLLTEAQAVTTPNLALLDLIAAELHRVSKGLDS